MYIICLPGAEKKQSTLIGVHGGDVYLTDMTFVGDEFKSRAVEVTENRRAFIARSSFSRFSTDGDVVMRLAPGARATLSDVMFRKNTIATAEPDAIAAGPVMGLYSSLERGGSRTSAVWFHNCSFSEHTSSVPSEVAVEGRACRVYSNTPLPTVWDRGLRREFRSWPLAPAGSVSRTPVNVFAKVEAGEDARFLRPSDGAIQRIVAGHARATGHPPVVMGFLPAGSDFITQDPYPAATRSRSVWTSRTIGLVSSLGGAALLVVATLLALLHVSRHTVRTLKRSRAATESARAEAEPAAEACAAPHPRASDRFKVDTNRATSVAHFAPDSGSEIPASCTSQLHWGTEVNFKTTMVSLNGPPPSPHAPATVRIEYLHAQLNSIAGDVAVLEHFRLLGPSERRQGGQGVVAFARGVHDGLAYALKFFLDRPSFLAERDLYRSHTLGSLLPQVQAEHDPEEAPDALKDSRGRPLPPCIVMERGEALPDWSKRAKPDVFQAVAVLAHVATLLRDMHEAGYVHRDIKPGNIMLLPRANRWTVIDFGCVVRVGESSALACTLAYAAPEVAAAIAAGNQTIVASPAVDAWAMGVVAFELLTGRPAFNFLLEGRDSVLGKLLGREELPWEGDLAQKNPAVRCRLGVFRKPVLSLLRRDPAQRATLATFCGSVRSTFAFSAAGDA